MAVTLFMCIIAIIRVVQGSCEHLDDHPPKSFEENNNDISYYEVPAIDGDEDNLSRFKRDTVDNSKVGEASEMMEKQESRTSKMLLKEPVPEGSREPRGATKQQWIKQPYPVHLLHVEDKDYEDNLPVSANQIRAPRVHFVTQRRVENGPLPENSYKTGGSNFEVNREREPRNRFMEEDLYSGRLYPSRFMQPQYMRELEDRDFYWRRPVNDDIYAASSSNPRDDPNYLYDRGERPRFYRYDPRVSRPLDYEYRPELSNNRQRRIIYYTTLPEVVRSPPNVNLRYRYSYNNPYYDDRYVNPSSRKSRPPQESDRLKGAYSAYPLKVSTDLNVRLPPKNPERRIYSEPHRRYAYKASPYRAD